MTTKKEEKFSKKRQKEMNKCFGKGEHLFALKKGDPGYKNIKGVKSFLMDPRYFKLSDELSAEERKRSRVFRPKGAIGGQINCCA